MFASRMKVYNASHLSWEQVECDYSADPPVVGKLFE